MTEIITGPSGYYAQQQQQPNLVGQIGQILALKQQQAEAPLRMQALQQQVQGGQLDLQQKQIQAKDAQAMSKVMQQWAQPPTQSTTGATAQTSPDYDRLLTLARQGGVSFGTYQGLQQHILDMKDKASDIVKNDAQAGSANATAMSTKNKMLIDAMSGVQSLPDDQLVPGLLAATQDLAQKQLLDPQHVQMAQQLAQTGDPAKIRQALNVQITGMGGFNKMLEDAQNKAKAQQEQGKSDPNSPFYAPSAQSVAMGTAPGAAQIQAGEVKQAAAKAGAEAKARQPYEMSLAAQRQALSQGDPNAAGQLLVNGDATLAELKSRGATPDFIARTLFAARKLSGGKYNAQQADAQFDVAKSPANVAFFGSAKSLTDKGGTLDQLQAAAKDIPQGQIPALNSIADWTAAATGSGPLAKYASLALGAADDYSKVMGGGQGSDTSRQKALDLFKANLSPAGRGGSIAGVRGAVGSQIDGRIGDNQVLKRMYGSQQNRSTDAVSGPPPGATHIVPGSDGRNHYTDGKRDLGIAP